MRDNVRRLVALVAFLLIGAAITAAQLDRSARNSAGLALMMPAGFGGFADARKALFVIESNPALAQSLMAGVLAHRPVSAGNLGLFARAAVENDEVELASDALTLAAARGWRDAYVQITVFGSAVAQGNYEAAALRLEALARGQRDQSVVNLAIMQLITQEQGREVLSERLAQSPGFENNFRAAAVANPDSSELFAATLREAEAKGAKTDCAILSRITLLGYDSGKTGQEATVWPSRCGTMDPGDLAFERSASPNPFGWTFHDVPGVTTRPGRDEGTLYFKNRDLVERPIATKYLRLPQGAYRLSLNSDASSTYSSFDQEAEMNAHILCGSRREGRDVALDRSSEGSFTFEIGPECGIQYVVLTARRGVRKGLEVSIDRIAS